jgi:hypothetical protein
MIHDASLLHPHLSFNFLFLSRRIQTLSIDINLSETINATLSRIHPSIDLKRDNLALHSGFIGSYAIGSEDGVKQLW